MAADKKDLLGVDKKNWYNDRYEYVRVQRNIFALISLLALVLSICAIFTVSQLAPLKTVEPFVIQVDQKSGATQMVNPLEIRQISANESVNQFFMVEYCRARETYLGTSTNYYNYNLVRVLSLPPIFSSYQQTIRLSNPESPGARLGSTGARQLKIANIKYLDSKKQADGNEIQRYMIIASTLETMNGGQPKVQQKRIFLEFRYTALDLSTEDRYLNPLGFQVTSYQIEDEASAQ